MYSMLKCQRRNTQDDLCQISLRNELMDLEDIIVWTRLGGLAIKFE